MASLVHFAVTWILLLATVLARPYGETRVPDLQLTKRQTPGDSSSVTVDLGYEVYQGISNASNGLNSFLGMRYAAPPTGTLRWQAPQAPTSNRSETLPANALPPRCPQNYDAPGNPGADTSGYEDCLFLSVYAPANATNLPVLVWIHGGGYGLGQGNQDLSSIINTNKNSFIGVAIQYRLGAFGFLSSDEVHRFGVVNAGLLDQYFALQWVQEYIHLFGGNPEAVTISGESAGGGSVMLQAMAYNGSIGASLFNNVIAASPYLPMQYGYADWEPSQAYYAFAQVAGCFDDRAQGGSSESIFQCLVGTDTETLQNASAFVSASGRFGTWGFLPVTDGSFVAQLPSQQLLQKQINGVNILSGNNADEGPLFTPQNVTTEDDFINYLRSVFPLFTDDDISQLLAYYPSTNASVNPSTPDYATAGDMGATAINESTFGSGQQQRADNVYAETTFVCPSYWLAEAFSGDGRAAYKYQYSVIGAEHGSDVSAYFGPPTPNQSPSFSKAFMTIWGNFITLSNPSIPLSIANGVNNTNTSNPTTDWPAYTDAAPYQINLNETGGVPFTTEGFEAGEYITEFEDPGLVNDFTLVNAYTWEGGRGARCEFWRNVSARVPE
ncbi:hypothetical protein MMC20_004504 [Loxospora ochrophaea]|nr:hypothetical protein [Loxospora ochrophaea]